MSDTQALLSKIAALRQRLEQATGMAVQAGTAVVSLVNEEKEALGDVRQLELQVAAGAQENSYLDATVRQIAETTLPPAPAVNGPAQLTFRARRCLERGRELLGKLRIISDDPLLKLSDDDPIEKRFRETAAIVDTALRTIQSFPNAAGSQLRLCEGLDAILDVVSQRIGAMTAVLDQRRRDRRWINTLADLLTCLNAGAPVDVEAFETLGAELVEDARDGAPVRFLEASPQEPARFIACHSLMVAQVMARLLRQDADLRSQSSQYMLVALVHDVGMLRVPAEMLAKAGALTDEERRIVEGHVRVGAELMARLMPQAGWLVDAVQSHHERLDGTGYPAGMREAHIPAMSRLLAVCDVYAALCMPRPHRAAKETRTALTDTLLLAEQGGIDRFQAERLLTLSFYPVGSAVELADGAVGVVIASPVGKRDLNTPARPVLAVLSDAQNQPLPCPQYIDLAHVDGRSIVRSLSTAERRQTLGKWYPEVA